MSWIITGTQRYQPDALLDQYPGAAAAYSLRNLVGTSNPAVVRVRRDNDNSEADFTATEVSDGTLAAWVGAGNDGFVRTWYDQSGNSRHAEQTTAANQPRIVASGVAVTQGLGNAIDWVDGGNYALVANFGATLPQPNTIFASCNFNGNSGQQEYIYEGLSSGNRHALLHFQAPNKFGTFAGFELFEAVADLSQGQKLFTSVFNTNASLLFKNGNQVASGSAGSNNLTGLTIGNYYTPSSVFNWDDTIAEIIVYPSNQSSNRVGIEANINAHYSIY